MLLLDALPAGQPAVLGLAPGAVAAAAGRSARAAGVRGGRRPRDREVDAEVGRGERARALGVAQGQRGRAKGEHTPTDPTS